MAALKSGQSARYVRLRVDDNDSVASRAKEVWLARKLRQKARARSCKKKSQEHNKHCAVSTSSIYRDPCHTIRSGTRVVDQNSSSNFSRRPNHRCTIVQHTRVPLQRARYCSAQILGLSASLTIKQNLKIKSSFVANCSVRTPSLVVLASFSVPAAGHNAR